MALFLRRLLLFVLIPAISSLYLFEAWTFASHWVKSRCLLSPTTRSSAVNCLRSLNVDVLPYHPQFGNFPVSLGKERMTPLAGVPHVTTLFCKEAGAWETFVADRAGFSNADSTWNQRSLDAVILGDSFALGECVPQASRAVSIVQKDRPNVLNMGYSSSSLLTHYARFMEYAKSRKPQHTFLFYYEGNDPLELLGEFQHPVWRKYLSDKGFSQQLEKNSEVIGNTLRPWLKRYVEIGDPYYVSFEFLPFLQLNNTRRMIRRAQNPQGYASLFEMTGGGEGVPPVRDFLNITEEIERRLKRETSRWQGKVHLVYLPSFRKEERGFYLQIRERTERAGLSFIDMEASFRVAGIHPYTDTWPNHYTPEAYAFLGRTLLHVMDGKFPAVGEKLALK